MTKSSAAAKFGINDIVRFIGTDIALTVTEYNEETRLYQVQRSAGGASSQWVLGIYLELLEPPDRDRPRST